MDPDRRFNSGSHIFHKKLNILVLLTTLDALKCVLPTAVL